MVAGTTNEGAALVSVRLVSVGQAVTVEAGATGNGAALASVRFVGVAQDSHCDGWHHRRGCYSGLCTLGRRGPSQPLWLQARQVSAQNLPLFAWSA